MRTYGFYKIKTYIVEWMTHVERGRGPLLVATVDYISNSYVPPQVLLEQGHLANCVIPAAMENYLVCSQLSLEHLGCYFLLGVE